MTTEEKARAYDEAIKKLRDFYRDYDTVSCLIDVKEELANLFPELKDLEDEKIRKTLLKSFVYQIKESHPDKEWLCGVKLKEIVAWLEKQDNKEPKKVSIWKHWKDGIAGNAEGEQIFLIKIGRVYSITSCLGCECDYIELSELDKLMREEKQGWKMWNEEDIKFIDMLIKEKEDALCLSCDVKESISLTYCCNALKLIKQRMKEQL